MSEMLHFRVSSGLKNIIGKELINDKFIAIFELVKNSYDAGAKNVIIKFVNIYGESSSIIIIDDGIGMNKDDIINKWLFVAYSEKKHRTYRDNLKKRRNYAGAKGVGRFSCDRLGAQVKLYSKIISEEQVNCVQINWNDFEKTDMQEFQEIQVLYDTSTSNQINESGTIIHIEGLREKWNRGELLKLKKALTQLVNPDATENYDNFMIQLDVEEELENDKNVKLRSKDGAFYDKDIVNGIIENHVFDALNVKTTKIEAVITGDGKKIVTTLNDRGVKLFEIEEKNKYGIKDIKGTLYSLNRAAKVNFTKIMGIESVNYGSVFIYKNGFRVYPYGEPEKDFMNIDRRKAQGYNRYLGTREIAGRIDIYGENNGFIETSSRNNGFISSFEMSELEDFFYEYMLKPLEKYVVQIIHWGEELVDNDDLVDNLQEYGDLDTILRKIKSKFKPESLIRADYNRDILKVIEERKSKKVLEEIEELKKIGIEKDDLNLIEQAERVGRKTRELEEQAAENRRIAQEEIERHEKTQKQLALAQRQVGVLQSRIDIGADDAINAMHIMKAYADTIDSNIEEVFDMIREGIEPKEIVSILHEIRQTCSKIMNAYNLVVNTEYNAETGNRDLDIVKFSKTYIEKQWNHKFAVFISGAVGMELSFNPLEFSIIIDNIIDNSKKANANKLDIIFQNDGTNCIVFRDDGFGISADADVDKLFEQGFTTTKGTGIGLYTVKKYVEKMQGTVRVNTNYKNGFELQMRF